MQGDELRYATPDSAEEFERKMKIARERMKYEAAYRPRQMIEFHARGL